MLKALLKTRSPEEVEVAIQGLRAIFPQGPISLKMIYGRSRIGFYVGWVSAFNAGVKASGVSRAEPGRRWSEGTVAAYCGWKGESGLRVIGSVLPAAAGNRNHRCTEPAVEGRTGPESVGAILGRMR